MGRKFCLAVCLACAGCTLATTPRECRVSLQSIGAVGGVAALDGLLPLDWIQVLQRAGFRLHGITQGGYVRFRHADTSEIWIRPSGEVLRLAPRVRPANGGRAYNPRVDASGRLLIETHSTNEFVAPP